MAVFAVFFQPVFYFRFGVHGVKVGVLEYFVNSLVKIYRKKWKIKFDIIGDLAHFSDMLTHIDIKNFPFSLIQRLKSVESATGLKMEYLMQAALLQGLSGRLDTPHSGVEAVGSESDVAHVSVGTATAGGVMVPCSGGGDAVVPVVVESGDGLDLNLR